MSNTDIFAFTDAQATTLSAKEALFRKPKMKKYGSVKRPSKRTVSPRPCTLMVSDTKSIPHTLLSNDTINTNVDLNGYESEELICDSFQSSKDENSPVISKAEDILSESINHSESGLQWEDMEFEKDETISEIVQRNIKSTCSDNGVDLFDDDLAMSL
ncbi:hypothetical protein GEMRC1_007177 [Eukaryota sp. GEM-RC1]